MAGPVTHIACAVLLIQSGALVVNNKQDFIMGTSFPLVRYIAELQLTSFVPNPNSVTFADIEAAPTSFQAGMLLHALVDQIRATELITPLSRSLHLPPLTYAHFVLESLEDSLIYDSVSSSTWSTVRTYFDTILPQELTYNIAHEKLETWHEFMKSYLSQKLTAPMLISLINEFPTCFAHRNLVTGNSYINFMFGFMQGKTALVSAINTFYADIVNEIINS